MRVVGFSQTLRVPEAKVAELVEAGLIFVCEEESCPATAHFVSAEAARLLALRFPAVH